MEDTRVNGQKVAHYRYVDIYNGSIKNPGFAAVATY